MQNAISMYSLLSCTPVSNLTHLAPHDNFSLMPNCSLGPPEYDFFFLKNKLIWALRKCMVSMATHIAILTDVGRGGAVHTNSIISQLKLIIYHQIEG